MKNLFNDITYIIFDLDGLLIDSEPLWKLAEERALRQLGKAWQLEISLTHIGLRISDVAASMVKAYNLPIEPSAFVKSLEHEMFALLEEQLAPMPGADEIIQKLHHAGYPLAIASSSTSEYISKSVALLGWSSYIRVIASGAEVPSGKPAPDVYLLAAQRLGAQPSHCLGFEDSLNGARAAQAAGLRTVAVPGHDFTAAQFEGIADAVFPTLSDILTHI